MGPYQYVEDIPEKQMTHGRIYSFLPGLIELHQTSWSSVNFLLEPVTRAATGTGAVGSNLMTAVEGTYDEK